MCALVVTLHDEPARPVGGHAHVVGERVAHGRGHVGEHLGLPHRDRIVQQRLVVEREIRGGRHAAAAGHADRAHCGLVERQQRLRWSPRSPATPECRAPPRARRASRASRWHEIVDVALLRDRHADLEARQTERLDDARAHEVAEVRTRAPLDQLGEHPVRRGRVVLVARAGLPVAAPAREALEAPVAVVPLERLERRAGKPDVCSSTCSTVITSFPFVANSGMISATRRDTSIAPSPIRIHIAAATTGFVDEKMT